MVSGQDDGKRELLPDPGSTKVPKFTFDEPSEALGACHFPRHFAADMKAVPTVGP